MILVCGYCATGKSTFSRKLSQLLGIPCFNKDILKETIADSFGSDSSDVRKNGSTVTFDLMAHIAERFLQAGQTCILEANFKLQEGERISRLLEEYNAKCLTFVFTGDLDVIYDRYTMRDQARARHWVHREAGGRDQFKVGHVQSGLGDIAIGQTIHVDTTVFEEVNYKRLFDAAEKFMHGKGVVGGLG